MRKIISIILIFIFSFSFILLNTLSNKLYGDVARIDPTDSIQSNPEIYGDKIVWVDNRDGTDQIYIYDIETGSSSPVDPTDSYQSYPRIYEDKVVWVDNRCGTRQIYLYDLSSPDDSPIRISPTESDQYLPAIFGDHIVWQDERDGIRQIYIYSISTGNVTHLDPTSSEQRGPDIYGQRIVWSDERHGNLQIYMYDMGDDTVSRLYPDEGHDQESASIYNDKVVWGSGPENQIYMYDIATETTTILDSSSSERWYCDIWGKNVVWNDLRTGHAQVYLYDIETRTDPVRISPTSCSEEFPAIYDDKIVWTDWRDFYGGGETQIYLYIRSPELPSSPFFELFEKIRKIFLSVKIGIFDFLEPLISPLIGGERSTEEIEEKAGEGGYLEEESEEETDTEESSEEGPTEDELEGEPAEEETTEAKSSEEELAEETIDKPTEEEEEKRPMTAPHVELKIHEGPVYVEDEMLCYYRIEAEVRGEPEPTLEWSRDDSHGAWGQEIAQVNLGSPSETYTLTCTATNPAGEDEASIDIEWGCPILEVEMAPETLEMVLPEEWTVTLHPSDIGYLVYPSGVNSETLIVALDSISNTAVQGFFAFDLSSFSGKKINSATLRLEIKEVYGDALYGMIGRLRIGPKNYLPLDPQDLFWPHEEDPYFFDFTLERDRDYIYELSSTEFTRALQNAIDGRSSKLQCYFTSMLTGESNWDYQTDGVEFTRDTISLILEVSD
jgi:TolB protein